MEVRIEQRPAFTVACVREEGPYMESANRAWQKFSAWLEGADVVDGASEFLGIMHDDPQTTPPEKLRYDACVTVPEGFTASGGVLLQHLADGEYAVTMHVGPYERLDETWGALMGWLAGSEREADSRACFEFYRNDPRETPAEELRTELYLPLKPLA